MSKVIEVVKKEEAKILQMHWMSSVEYNSEKGTVDFTFDPKLKPYLLQLQREFTSYKLRNVLALNSGYAIRFYELLKKWEKIGIIEYTLEELRKRLGTGNKYKEYSNFKLRVIDPARRELSEKTDIKFNYEELKKGRKVVALKFIISTNREKRTKIVEDTKSTEETLLEELNGLARGYHVSNEVFYRWVALGKNIWGLEYTSQLRNLILYINQQSNKNNPIGLANYLLKEKGKLAQQGYDSTIQVEKKEILPEWFNKNNDGNDKKDSRKKEVTYIERQEMEKLLEKYKVY